MTRIVVRMITLIAFATFHASGADDPSPALAGELQKLAKSSQGAKALIGEAPRPGHLKFIGELGYYAAEVSGWSFERMQSEFPALCAEGQLVATVHAADDLHYVIYTSGGLGPFAGTLSASKGFVRLDCGKSVKLRELAGYYRYSVGDDIRGDVLVATFSPRVVRDATVRTVFISHLYIHDGHIEALKNVTEEYPIRVQQPKE